MEFNVEDLIRRATDIATEQRVAVYVASQTSRVMDKEKRKFLLVQVRALDTMEHWALVDDVMSGLQIRLVARGKAIESLLESLNAQVAASVEIVGNEIVSATPGK